MRLERHRKWRELSRGDDQEICIFIQSTMENSYSWCVKKYVEALATVVAWKYDVFLLGITIDVCVQWNMKMSTL